ncbi:hypothetical protein IFM89_009917 [Coptis chinensis]|uniref:Uncharacterized protein n=1 Tax=Coptis chinensis TaxID=261450 RepID=A0A835HZH7_9MAGN|nr:hypothetical protein IFM89_009917 [Coptis chinensis]
MKKKKLLDSAPWRVVVEEEDSSEMFKDAKVKVTKEPGSSMATMHVPSKKSSISSKSSKDNQFIFELDPDMQYALQRNYEFLQRVFTVDTLVKHVPPKIADTVERNLRFFTRVFTQFFDDEGIGNAQMALGIRERRGKDTPNPSSH